MKTDQIETILALGAQGAQFGSLGDRYFESAFFIHGHVCGGMPLGFRAGLAALHALGVDRELNMAKQVIVETATGHAAGCFANGVQMATGCTFGKGLIERAGFGKWALTLIDKASGKAVRVSVRRAVMEGSYRSPFVEQRRQGIAPTEIPLKVSRPLVEGLLGRSDAELFVISEVFDYPVPTPGKTSFNLAICSVCGEAVAENRARVRDGQPVCLPCSGYGS